jgi:hypothetical protein
MLMPIFLDRSVTFRSYPGLNLFVIYQEMCKPATRLLFQFVFPAPIFFFIDFATCITPF